MAQSLQEFKAELFKALAHPTRIRVLELLRSGEKSVSELSSRLDLEQPAVSQQLAVLRARYLVLPRKEGTTVYYRVADPRLFDLLDSARAIFDAHLDGLQAMVGAGPAEGDRRQAAASLTD